MTPKVRGALVRACLLAAVALSGGCKKPSRLNRPDAGAGPAAEHPTLFPATLPREAYLGAAACVECHAELHEKWTRTPHGRAMTVPSPDTVLAAFDGREITVSDGKIVPLKDGDRFVMEMHSGGRTERHAVALVIGAGRQHQDYVARLSDGRLALMPLFWGTKTRRWLSLEEYQAVALDPASPAHWKNRSLVENNCLQCHLSQATFHFDGKTDPVKWVDLPINCEACHGPGRDHVQRQRATPGKDGYGDLRLLNKEEEAAVCGRCHASHGTLLSVEPNGRAHTFPTTLASDAFRPDGTQFHTPYQYGAHVVSRCFVDGAMTCSACHDPHTQEARDLSGQSAEGVHSNRQCTVCHRDRIDARAATKHSRHPEKVTCVDCHMAMSFMGDKPEVEQRTSDHTVSIPRPRESLEVGTPNACTTCHENKNAQWALAALEKWGASEALKARPWVVTIAQARKRAPGATERLMTLLTDASSGLHLRLAALELLEHQPTEPGLVPVLTPLTASDHPQERSLAFRALYAHDPQNTAEWTKKAAADADPRVRLDAMLAPRQSVTKIEGRFLDRFVADALQYTTPSPLQELMRAVDARETRAGRALRPQGKRVELVKAIELVELALAYAPAGEVRFNLEQQQARLAKKLATVVE